MDLQPTAEQDIIRTFDRLGGGDAIPTPVLTSLDAHDLLLTGLPALALLDLTKGAALFACDQDVLEKAVGMSLRTPQRRCKDTGQTLLSIEQSSRIWKFAEILGRATEVFGSQEAAESWLNRTAIGLDQRNPIDLLATTVGDEAGEDCLTRIDYGVFA